MVEAVRLRALALQAAAPDAREGAESLPLLLAGGVKLVIVKMVAASIVVHAPPLAERLQAVAAAQKLAVLDALEPLAPARERSG
ncbi:MAG TPA: hypothetical protein VLA83_13495 [Candidatus Binatia bacterium]|nr:hypothetical protein [Candidatus Binatia bacterium]